MSGTTTTPSPESTVPTNWRARMREIGKDAFIREEMTRLGFWPPDEETARTTAEAEAELKQLYTQLANLRSELRGVETEIGETGDIPKLLAEIRRRRIERVRGERAKKREERVQAQAAKREQDREWRKKTLPFLGRGVSAGLRYETGGEAAKLTAAGLPVLVTAADVAAAIGISEPELAWLTYHRVASSIDHYHRFTIPKRRGGVRVISSPKSRLRVAQGWLLREVVQKLPVHEEAAMAFRPGCSIEDNAARHAGKTVIARLDLKDFFPSINVRRVKGLFEALGYNEGVATLFALLATESPRVAATLNGEKRFVALGGRCLPQGACTSPGITNHLCRGLDARLTGAARSMGFTYTRYADDLVFSHDEKEAPIGMLLDLARRILTDAGFTVNEEKTAVLRPQHRQTVTGLVVNSTGDGDAEPRVSRNDLRRFRAFLHHVERDGAPAVSQRIGKDALAYASGYLAFLHMVQPEQAKRLQEKHPWIARWRREKGTGNSV